jgi:DNA helicase-2/ATP-dependent DNA helicase PcrA
MRRTHDAGTPWNRLAALVRTNAQVVVLAEALRAAGIPVRTPGGAGLLEEATARRALAELGRRPAAPVATAVADLDAWAAPGGTATDPDEAPAPDAREVSSVLSTLADLARHARRLDPAMTVGGWLAWLPVMLGGDGDDRRADSVTVCSFHRAKGLEWSAVWVCGVESGLVPIGHAQTAAALAEERRLLYVALTRAEDELHCSWAETRTFGARSVPREASEWLGLLACAGAGTAPTADAGEWQRRLTDQRTRLRAGRDRRRPGSLPPGWPPPDGRVLEALREWRAETARGSAVPAHVVLHDTVLTALASLRPVDPAGLLAVPGLGPVKADRFGSTLLRLVAGEAVPA